jgi:hypothetical protein
MLVLLFNMQLIIILVKCYFKNLQIAKSIYNHICTSHSYVIPLQNYIHYCSKRYCFEMFEIFFKKLMQCIFKFLNLNLNYFVINVYLIISVHFIIF